MENELQMTKKMQRQLARQEEVRAERALRREQEMQNGLVNAEGILMGSANFAFDQMLLSLERNPDIDSASLHDNQLSLRHTDRTLHVALEFCPLYTQGTLLSEGKLDVGVATEADLQASRVGKKWNATKAAILALQKISQQFNTQLILHATFADIGIMVGTREDIDEAALQQHENVYRTLLHKFSDAQGIPFEFKRLSELSTLSDRRGVKKFVVASEGKTLARKPTEDGLLQLLDLTREEIPLHRSERANVLLKILDACNGNIDLLRCLVDTYINYPTTIGCDMHLAVERNGSLLALQVMHKDSDAAKIPRLDIIVT